MDQATGPAQYPASTIDERPNAAGAERRKRTGPMRRGPPATEGPDAAWPLRRCNCGSLTGDSGGPGRRARLMYGPAQVRVEAGRSKGDSFAEGLTAIILRLGVFDGGPRPAVGHFSAGCGL